MHISSIHWMLNISADIHLQLSPIIPSLLSAAHSNYNQHHVSFLLFFMKFVLREFVLKKHTLQGWFEPESFLNLISDLLLEFLIEKFRVIFDELRKNKQKLLCIQLSYTTYTDSLWARQRTKLLLEVKLYKGPCIAAAVNSVWMRGFCEAIWIKALCKWTIYHFTSFINTFLL